MKLPGIIRRMDDLGRVVIPKEIRNAIQIEEGDPVEWIVEGNKVVLGKYRERCCLCSSFSEPLSELYPSKLICKPCIKMIVDNKENLFNSLS